MAPNLLPWQPKKGDFKATSAQIGSDEYPWEGQGGAPIKSCGAHFHGNHHVVMATKKRVFMARSGLWLDIR